MRFSLLLLLLLPLTNLGCTMELWGEALDSDLRSPYVSGTTGSGARQRIVVDYRGYGGSSGQAYALPIDTDGRLTGVLVYTGLERTATAIERDLTAPQRSAVQNFRFPAADRVANDDIVWPDEPAPLAGWLDLPSLHCRAIALDVNNRTLPLVPTGRTLANKPPEMKLPEDARIVLLPDRQRRPTSEQAAAIGRAVLLTPLTLVGDVVVVPLFLILVATDSFPKC